LQVPNPRKRKEHPVVVIESDEEVNFDKREILASCSESDGVEYIGQTESFAAI
jgi:hypothetical protein